MAKIDIEDVKRLNIESGEILVVKSTALLTRHQIELIGRDLSRHLPAGVKVLVLDKTLSLCIVVPPKGSEVRTMADGEKPENPTVTQTPSGQRAAAHGKFPVIA